MCLQRLAVTAGYWITFYSFYFSSIMAVYVFSTFNNITQLILGTPKCLNHEMHKVKFTYQGDRDPKNRCGEFEETLQVKGIYR